jgi:DNA-binding response OmpR family regulator
MDGFEATVRIKANPATRHVPVIFMTGLTESEHVIEGFEVGGVDYVRKPVNVHELPRARSASTWAMRGRYRPVQSGSMRPGG